MKKNEHDLKGYDVAWRTLCDVFGGLHDTNPEWLAVTRFITGSVVTKNKQSVQVEKLPKVTVKKEIDNRGTKSKKSNLGNKGGVLFIPIFSRSYCLNVCYELAKSIQEESGEPIQMLTPEGQVPEEIANDEMIQWHDKNVLREINFSVNLWLRAGVAYLRSVRAIKNDERVLHAMQNSFSSWRLGLAKFVGSYYWEIACAKRWLKSNEIKAVVVINDVIKPSAAFVAAANMLNIPSVVIQHGVPGPQSAPAMGRHSWTWGASSTDLLSSFGADVDTMECVGNLEIDKSIYSQRSNKSGKMRLLLLSQWVGMAGWGEEEFGTFFKTAAEAAENAKDTWELAIRLHPSEGEEAREYISQMLEGIAVNYSFNRNERTIEEDISDCDFSCTIFSSAIMHAVAASKPCAVIISQHLEQRVGASLFASKYIARNSSDLTALLDASGVMTDEERNDLLVNQGSAYSVAAKSVLDKINNKR